MEIVQVGLVPAGPHSPSQPVNSKPFGATTGVVLSEGVSVSVICSPGAKVNVHAVGHAIPERALPTLPPLGVLIRFPFVSKVRTSTVSVEPGGTVGVVVLGGLVPPLLVVGGFFGGVAGWTVRACSEKRPQSRPGAKPRRPSRRLRRRAPTAVRNRRPVETSSP